MDPGSNPVDPESGGSGHDHEIGSPSSEVEVSGVGISAHIPSHLADINGGPGVAQSRRGPSA